METLLYEKQAAMAKAMAHPIRIAAIAFLKDGEQCVCDIAAAVGTERSNLSKHLSVMVHAGILQFRRDGLKMMYKIKTPHILKSFDNLRDCVREQAIEQQNLLKSL